MSELTGHEVEALERWVPATREWLIREPEESYRSNAKPRLLDQVRAAIRTRHYSYRTEEAYIGWIRRFILFHGKRHPAEMLYTHVLNRGGRGVESPADRLGSGPKIHR